MTQRFKQHFRFENAGDMFQASFKHTNRHKAVLTRDDHNIMDFIRFYTAWHGAAHLTFELLKSTGRCLLTIHYAIRKLIELGIIEECYSEIDGIPTRLYTMLPFEENSVENNDHSTSNDKKDIFLVVDIAAVYGRRT